MDEGSLVVEEINLLDCEDEDAATKLDEVKI